MITMQTCRPDSDDQVAAIIRDAQASGTSLVVEGNGSKRALGRPSSGTAVLSVSGLSGILSYEPDEMVVTVRAGTPLLELEALLAKKGQSLAFEPSGLSAFLGEPHGRATIGGTIAAGISGPRRFSAGAPRDHLLGFRAIDGRGEPFRAGGKVVKNVTGYDLPKLAAGSFGTLFVITEMTLRAVPCGSASAFVVMRELEPAHALGLLRRASASAADPTGLAFVPALTAQALTGQSSTLALFRLEGEAAGVDARAMELRRLLGAGASMLDPVEGLRLFAALRDLSPLFAHEAAVWKVSVPPSNAMQAIEKLSPKNWFADWAGGAVWCEPGKDTDPHGIARALGGHATLFRRGGKEPAQQEPFAPLEPATLALTRRLKAAFDPSHTLNPGRMYEGI
jgi:glycolate oxidase FAD binding subunit